MNLSWKLAGVVNGWLPEDVLDTYEQERKPHVRSLIHFALAVGRAMTAGGELGDFARRVVVPRLHLIPVVRKRISDSATPPLHRSALVMRSRGRRQLAGRLCPNPVLAEGKRFDSLVGPGFGVITSARLTSSQRAELTARGAAVVTTQPGSALAAWLRTGRATTAVVRPDRTVLCAGRDVSETCSAVPVFTVGADA